MLIQFRTENHLSLRDEQVFSMAAAASDRDDARLIQVDGLSEPLLRVAAVYGANASGKSNLLDALLFVGEAVHESARVWEPGGEVPRKPFLLRDHDPALPSLYELDVVAQGVRYRYGFVVDDERVREEWLYAWPRGRRQSWFEREGDEFTFGREFKGQNKAIAEMTRPNTLFLSMALQANHPQVKQVGDQLIVSPRVAQRKLKETQITPPTLLDFYRSIDAQEAEQESFPKARERLRGAVLDFLKSADLGIRDFVVEDERTSEEGPGRRPSQQTQSLLLLHESSEETGSFLPVDLESTGTVSLIQNLPGIINALDHGSPLVFDEIERAFHPLLAAALVRTFQDPKLNPKGAQLIFTTHNPSLLGSYRGQPLLRRDQVWFTEKDREGATHLYPLTDFSPRKSENLERGYLQGRYGAIPYLGRFETPGLWEGEE